MCATCSSVLVLPRSSWCVWAVNRHAPPQPARMRPACSSLSSLPGVAGQELEQLAGRCGAGVCACVCAACVRACGVCARVVFACVRRAACGCGVGVRAAARVRSRCSSRQLRFLRRAFGSGRVSDVEGSWEAKGKSVRKSLRLRRSPSP